MTLTPAGLRCAHKDDPFGVAPDRIRFSWILQGAGRTGYRWKVQAWDETGAGSGWSAPAAFETGFSERTSGWHASWITLGRIREEFRPPSEPGPSDPVLNALMPAPYLTGWLRLGVDGPPGARVRIRHGEILAPDGTLYTDNLRTARAADEFTTAGGPAVLEPRFTLHGFRYAEITGYPGDIGQADLTARVVHSDTPATGPVASGWRRDGGRFTFSLDLPPNVTASVRIPSDDPAVVRDRAGAGPVSVAGYPGAPGAQEAVFAVGPGSHEFTGPALTAEFS